MLKVSHKFSELEIEQLKNHSVQCKYLRVKERILSILMFATLQISTLQIAELIGKSERTIENWIIKYINEGLEGILSYNYTQKKSF
jgi:transposase